MADRRVTSTVVYVLALDDDDVRQVSGGGVQVPRSGTVPSGELRVGSSLAYALFEVVGGGRQATAAGLITPRKGEEPLDEVRVSSTLVYALALPEAQRRATAAGAYVARHILGFSRRVSSAGLYVVRRPLPYVPPVEVVWTMAGAVIPSPERMEFRRVSPLVHLPLQARSAWHGHADLVIMGITLVWESLNRVEYLKLYSLLRTAYIIPAVLKDDLDRIWTVVLAEDVLPPHVSEQGWLDGQGPLVQSLTVNFYGVQPAGGDG